MLYWLFCMQQVRTNVLMADDTAELSTGQNVLSDGQKTICVIDYIYEIRLKTNHINNSNLALCDGRTNDISWDWKWISDGFHVPRRSAGLSVLEPKYCHFDAKFVNACTGSFQDDNLLVHLVMWILLKWRHFRFGECKTDISMYKIPMLTVHEAINTIDYLFKTISRIGCPGRCPIAHPGW